MPPLGFQCDAFKFLAAVIHPAPRSSNSPHSQTCYLAHFGLSSTQPSGLMRERSALLEDPRNLTLRFESVAVVPSVAVHTLFLAIARPLLRVRSVGAALHCSLPSPVPPGRLDGELPHPPALRPTRTCQGSYHRQDSPGLAPDPTNRWRRQPLAP